ncbi:response regulator [Paenibacillus nasutitermitis]|uniref:AraC family transcriptional regulator n=1 Tax=Paenibacillus nasutitermitis TaxID=1652958 RepID=A0A916YKK5_9BACL|nr:response regulator [Paenibacillus nasutitermitis]GGD49144.1 AraC family transcriptional regulator [Paenibacillus nasutitermitis]
MYTAFIVDDEPRILTGMQTIINWVSFGFVIVGEASNGLEAQERIAELKPDLVITDIKMPLMDGLELVRVLNKQYPDIQLLILSGYNDFSYAKEALRYGVNDYLLKPVDPIELGQTLELIYNRLWHATQLRLKEMEQLQSLRDIFLGKVARGEIIQNLIDTASTYDIGLQGDQFCLLIVSVDRFGEFLISLPGEEIRLKRFAVRNVMTEIVSHSGYVFEISDQLFGILLTDPVQTVGDRLSAMAEHIVDCTERYVKESVTIGVGSIVSQPLEIKHSYNQALKAMEQKFFFVMKHVFIYKPEVFKGGLPDILWDDDALLLAIREGSPERIAKEIGQLIASLKLHYMTLAKLKYGVITTIIHLAKLTEEYHGDWQTFYTGKSSEAEHIIGHGDIQLLEQFLMQISLEIFGYVESTKNRKSDSRIDEIIEHIEQNYMRELNLKELSKLFYINKVYLGQLFKKKTGEYFNDYINKVRVKHAYRLLEQTSLSNSEIAERVGYKYADHFYRWFKQTYDMNPGELRKRNDSDKE